ncbi:MAG: hypothetical protein PHC30_03760 [Lentisphaeria bacterium]|nr:hypothetical protein [Lentisphaeria bacterium]
MSRNGYPHMVIDEYVDRLRARRAERTRELTALKTREDALAYQAKLRQAIARSFGPKPKQVPLALEYTGTLQLDGYRIEKLRFQSRPDFWVTANLYLPDQLEQPAPAVLGACGHSELGKAAPVYQDFCIRLVRNGFVVLIYDPIQQGERDQYIQLSELGMATSLCCAHNVMGKQLELVGDFFGAWRVWDGRCALDALLTRPEVDPKRVGITGNSGGGTLTEWLWANEYRLTMAAPSCHVTSFLNNLENELATDSEQCPPGIIGSGLEMVDMMIARAPQPAILLGQKYDFFERRGLQEAHTELRRFYELLGAGESTELFIGPTTHGYSPHNQMAMVNFFRRHAGLGGQAVDLPPQAQPPEALWVCPEGNVVKAGSRPIYALIRDRAVELAGQRTPPAGQPAWRTMLTGLLQLPPRAGLPHYRVLRPQRIGDRVWARYALETEGHVRAFLRKRLAEAGWHNTLDVEPDVCLYLPHFSAEHDAQNSPCCQDLGLDGILYGLDPRGLGESLPSDTDAPFFHPYGMDYLHHSFGLMFRESFLGRRLFDVLRTLDLLTAEGARTVTLHGRGQGALLAALTATMHDAIGQVTLYDAPESFQSWIDAGTADWPAANCPFGALAHFDLPDLYASLGDRLTITNSWGPHGPGTWA